MSKLNLFSSGRPPRRHHPKAGCPDAAKDPGRSGLAADDQAVQEVVGFLLAFGITSLLVAGSLLSIEGAHQNARERAQASEADALAHRIAREMLTMADLGSNYPTGTASKLLQLPNQLAGASYTIHLEAAPDQVRVSPTTIDEEGVGRLLGVSASVPICPGQVLGGDLTVAYGVGPGPTTPCIYIS